MQTNFILYTVLGTVIGISFITIVIPMANASAVCESGWSLFDGNCYKVFNQMRTQKCASYLCHGQHARLVSIHSKAENEFVTGLLDSADRYNNENFWIGLKLIRPNWNDNFVSECQWTEWSAAQTACPESTREGGQYPWAHYEGHKPEPNNGGKQEEECVVIYHTDSSMMVKTGWVDWSCDKTAGFVCKKNADRVVVAKSRQNLWFSVCSALCNWPFSSFASYGSPSSSAVLLLWPLAIQRPHISADPDLDLPMPMLPMDEPNQLRMRGNACL